MLLFFSLYHLKKSEKGNRYNVLLLPSMKKKWKEVVKFQSYLRVGGRRREGGVYPSFGFCAFRVPVKVNVINVNKNLSLFEKQRVPLR